MLIQGNMEGAGEHRLLPLRTKEWCSVCLQDGSAALGMRRRGGELSRETADAPGDRLCVQGELESAFCVLFHMAF